MEETKANLPIQLNQLIRCNYSIDRLVCLTFYALNNFKNQTETENNGTKMLTKMFGAFVQRKSVSLLAFAAFRCSLLIKLFYFFLKYYPRHTYSLVCFLLLFGSHRCFQLRMHTETESHEWILEIALRIWGMQIKPTNYICIFFCMVKTRCDSISVHFLNTVCGLFFFIFTRCVELLKHFSCRIARLLAVIGLILHISFISDFIIYCCSCCFCCYDFWLLWEL